MDDQSDSFSQLFVQTLELGSGHGHLAAEVVIDKLLKLNYGKRIFAVTKQIAGEMLCHLARNTPVIRNRNEYLLSKYLQLVVHLCSSQELILEGDAANVLIAELQTVWSLCMKNSVLQHSLLDAVMAITYQNGPYISHENLLFLFSHADGNLPAIASDSSIDIEMRRAAVQCLSGFCLMCENGNQLTEKYMELCTKLFISILQELPATPKDITMCRMVFALAKGLHNILSSSSNAHTSNIGPLLAVLKKFMLYGLPGLSDSVPAELHPVQVPELYPAAEHDAREDDKKAEPTHKTRERKKKRKKKQVYKGKGDGATTDNGFVAGIDQLQLEPGQSSMFKSRCGPDKAGLFRPSWLRVTSSESEYSDTEGAQKAKLRSFSSKIRQMSLSVLYLTVKLTPKRTMLGFWSSFLPDSPSLLTNSSSLFTSFRQDPAPKCRAAALGIVGAMLDGSRWFLSLAAEETGCPSQYQATSFVPFSVTLAASIREIHKQLLSAASNEQSTLALVQLLKSISILVANTPYHKMKPGLLVKLATQSRYYLSNSRDINVRVVCLTVLGSIVSTSAPLGEVANVLIDSTSTSSASGGGSGSHTPVETTHSHGSQRSTDIQPASWLIDQCMELAMPRKTASAHAVQSPEAAEVPHPLRVEALQTLARVVKGYLPAVKHYLSAFADMICECLMDLNPTVRLHACKLLEELGNSLLQMQKMTPSNELDKTSLSIWKKFLSGPLQTVMQEHGSFTLQGKACDSLSTIGTVVFQSLPKNLQMLCITLLLGFTSDENALVRSTSVRALGVYVMYPHLREDVGFLEDVACSVLRSLEDSFLNVRANAAWSLGNLTDTIIVNKESRPAFREEFQSSLLLQLLQRGIQAMQDKDKVRFNMMRVVGNLLRFADKEHMKDRKFKSSMLEATTVLARMTAGNAMVKVRWNACTACSNFLRNGNLPLGDPQWTDHIYQALCESVVSCKNFKVRIKASLALSTPSKRAHYGSVFSDVFAFLIKGLEDSGEAADFSEFKFKDKLQDQLCSTLIHLTTLSEEADLTKMCESLEGRTEEISAFLASYQRRILQGIELESEATVNTSLNSPSSLACDDVTTQDMPEEYAVTKQLTAKQKFHDLNEAINRVETMAQVTDDNDNTVPTTTPLSKKQSSSDYTALKTIFTFTNI